MDTGIGDIVERDTSHIEPPKAPVKKHNDSIKKKWAPRRRPVVLDPTAPNNKKTPENTLLSATSGTTAGSARPEEEPLSEPERIHLENIRKIQKMSPDEIEREREEIFKSMNPEVLQSLLRRAELKERENMLPKKRSSRSLVEPGPPVFGQKAPPKGSEAEWDPSSAPPRLGQVESEDSTSFGIQPNDLHREDARTTETYVAQADSHTHGDSTLHFAPPPEELRKYFPNLPVETEKLAWMQPISNSEEQEYSAESTSVAPSELRFDFKGNLITPRQSRVIPSSAGLHHHGDAPSAAGYTIPELAHLSRSSHPAQRAMAIQTVGRVLHKLRTRKFARSSELHEGLSALIEQTRIMDTLVEAADEKTRSQTVRSLATEALWLANTDNSAKESEASSKTKS